MGSIVFKTSLSKLVINPEDIQDINPNNMQCLSGVAMSNRIFYFHNDIESDCYKIFTCAIEFNRQVEIYYRKRVIHMIGMSNVPMRYISSEVISTGSRYLV